MDINDYTDEELKTILQARVDARRVSELPQPLDVIDINSILDFAKSIRDEVAAGTYYEDNDNYHYAYEVVMEAVFGKDYFKWHSKNT